MSWSRSKVSPVMSYHVRMRYLLDTCIVASGLRSPSGASAALLREAVHHRFTPVLSVALVLEYASVCRDPEQRIASGLSESEVDMVIDTLCSVCHRTAAWYQWRPQLRDPNDEMVLEAAINGGADAIVTFNIRDLGAPSEHFGIPVVGPAEALRRIREARKEPESRIRRQRNAKTS